MSVKIEYRDTLNKNQSTVKPTLKIIIESLCFISFTLFNQVNVSLALKSHFQEGSIKTVLRQEMQYRQHKQSKKTVQWKQNHTWTKLIRDVCHPFVAECINSAGSE